MIYPRCLIIKPINVTINTIGGACLIGMEWNLVLADHIRREILLYVSCGQACSIRKQNSVTIRTRFIHAVLRHKTLLIQGRNEEVNVI